MNPARPRVREFGLRPGSLPPGPLNAITDVAGVRVGHLTLVWGNGPLVPGKGPVRTGVTVVVPHSGNVYREKVPAAGEVINGFGKAVGLAQVAELGVLETPVALTSTLCVGLAADGLITAAIRQNPDIGVRTATVNPVVLECNDGYLNDVQGRHVKADHVLQALAGAAPGAVPEGAVGAGTGMSAFGFKGGIGTASRLVEAGGPAWTVGALVLANFGRTEDLTVAGVPVGLEWLSRRSGAPPEAPPGSVVVVLATDAPMDARQLGRLARRAVLGLARVGSVAAHQSGDFALAFSTAGRVPHDAPGPVLAGQRLAEDRRWLDPLFLAAVESTEEAVLNALWTAEDMVGRDGHRRDALPLDDVAEILRAHGRL